MASEFIEQIGKLGPAVLRAVDAFEKARRRLHPPAIEQIRAALDPIRSDLRIALDGFRAADPDEGLQQFATDFENAAAGTLKMMDLFADDAPDPTGFGRVLEAMREQVAALSELREGLAETGGDD